MYSYESKAGYLNKEIGNSGVIPNRDLPRNLFLGKPYFGFIPKFNMNIGKADLFLALGLWENANGIGVRGNTYILSKEGDQFNFKTGNNYIIVHNSQTPILAGDIIILKGVRLNVIEAVGILTATGLEIDLKLDLVLIQKINEPFLAQDFILSRRAENEQEIIDLQRNIARLVFDVVFDAIIDVLKGATAGPYPVISPVGKSLVRAAKTFFGSNAKGFVDATEAKIKANQQFIEGMKLWQ